MIILLILTLLISVISLSIIIDTLYLPRLREKRKEFADMVKLLDELQKTKNVV